MHCLTDLGGVECLGEVDKGLAQTYVANLPIQTLIFRIVEKNLQVFLGSRKCDKRFYSDNLTAFHSLKWDTQRQ